MQRVAIWSVRRSVAALYFTLFGGQIALTLWLLRDSESFLELWGKASAPIITSAGVALVATELVRLGWRVIVVLADIIRESWEARRTRIRREQLDDLVALVMPRLEKRADDGLPPPTVDELREIVEQALDAREQG